MMAVEVAVKLGREVGRGACSSALPCSSRPRNRGSASTTAAASGAAANGAAANGAAAALPASSSRIGPSAGDTASASSLRNQQGGGDGGVARRLNRDTAGGSAPRRARACSPSPSRGTSTRERWPGVRSPP